MTRTSFALSLATGACIVALAGCGSQPFGLGQDGKPLHFAKNSSPIVGGTTDNGHPAVALILNNGNGDPSKAFLCTGSLIAPNVILTAGHCSVTDDKCGPGTCQTLPAATFQVGGGTDPTHGADWVSDVAEVHTNPAYDGSDLQNQGIPGDDAILVLTTPAPVTPMPWLDANDTSIYQVGTTFTAVGYGIDDGTNPQTAGVGVKKMVQLQIAQIVSDAFAYNAGPQGQNSCSGDSGGPAIVNANGVDTVIATVSYGDQTCQSFGVDVRTDFEKSFISTYATPFVPTPTPNPSASPTDTPGNGNNGDGKKEILPGVSCSVAPVSATAEGAPLAAAIAGLLAGFVLVARIRRES